MDFIIYENSFQRIPVNRSSTGRLVEKNNNNDRAALNQLHYYDNYVITVGSFTVL